MRRFLEREGLAREDSFAKVDQHAGTRALRARDRVLAMPDLEPARLLEHAYPNGSPLVDGERDQYAAYLASFAEGK